MPRPGPGRAVGSGNVAAPSLPPPKPVLPHTPVPPLLPEASLTETPRVATASAPCPGVDRSKPYSLVTSRVTIAQHNATAGWHTAWRRLFTPSLRRAQSLQPAARSLSHDEANHIPALRCSPRWLRPVADRPLPKCRQRGQIPHDARA